MPSEAEISANSAPATPPPPPPNFWGDMPEEEYYTSQGVRNSKSYFETPNGKLFTQSFLPLDGEIKGTVYMSHGYGSDTSWMFQKICMSFSTWGYAVFAADLLGHGRLLQENGHGLGWFMGLPKRRWAASQVIHEDRRIKEEQCAFRFIIEIICNL